ncbi:hypothetical protein BDY17DRAFT_127713 [Neohortaea acidophila]|uniref:Myosin class II heavy chain n=1 Tax=Neohortaea acidophila TaxID=245834 RepID=A0A6A6PXE4_9PEZI|nr:uncharacterized protein BDY17DRAFT_127713 [Neohortaea acidophila]KAF2484404.1 hypothetical protein BDY17DRAFT_127713 [Neohortaea acidophila]
MSSLFASRWAATPPADETPQKEPAPRFHPPTGAEMSPPSEPDQKKIEPGIFASRWADTPSPVDTAKLEAEFRQRLTGGKVDSTADKSDDKSEGATRVAGGDIVEQGTANEGPASNEDTLPDTNASEVGAADKAQHHVLSSSPLSPTKSRLDAPRFSKKKVSWRGKTCVISIPDIDYNASRLAEPSSLQEHQERLKRLEDAGYDISGFDMPAVADDSQGAVHAKSIFPDENESRAMLRQRDFKIMLPDLDKWAAYMDFLTEQKLAALGVSSGPLETAPTPSQDVSRQLSGQYPPLPYSPPIPTGSAAILGRPGMVRGHSHAMSVVSPISPVNAPFGHAHRHSVFASPFGFQQIQPPSFNARSPLEQQYSPPSLVSGLRSVSPQGQFAIPGSTRVVAEEQAGEQHGQHHTPRQPQSIAAVTPSGSVAQPKHNLSQLPEEADDEEKLLGKSEPAATERGLESNDAYVPPHKRAEFHAEIATPTPLGHRHNISEGLERELLEAEKRQQRRSQDYIVVEEESSGSGSDEQATQTKITPEKDPLSLGYVVQESAARTLSTHKKTGSRFNVAAPAFKFNPDASFQPGSTAFTFGSFTSKPLPPAGHNRRISSSNFNVAAPEFKPLGMQAMPKAEFSFSTSGPSFNPKAPVFGAPKPTEPVAAASGPSIFGKVEIPEFIRPAQRSKAVPITKPEDLSDEDSESEYEDDEGRLAQSEDRLKRARKVGDDGDEVPRFAEPTPMPAFATESLSESRPGLNDEPRSTSDDQTRVGGAADSEEDAVSGASDTANDAFDSEFDRTYDEIEPQAALHKHRLSSSLSALAQPFRPHLSVDAPGSASRDVDDSFNLPDVDEDESQDDDVPTSPLKPRESASIPGGERLRQSPDLPTYHEGYGEPTHYEPEPSFAEIDAVMRQLNEIDGNDDLPEPRALSPLPSSELPVMSGVTYLPGVERSAAPSPSPRRSEYAPEAPGDSSFTIHERTDSGEHVVGGWSQVNRLNKAAEVPTSDWSADFSAHDDDKLHQRSNFLDSHIDNLIGGLLERRLRPLEESLQAIHSSIDRRPTSRDLTQKRSSSAVDSDADDEDELSEEQRQRPISRGKDKRVDQIKAAVAEALRERSPARPSQSLFDLQDLHSYLVDMKASFAQAASSGFDLDEVRAIIEDAINRPRDEDDFLRRAAEEREAETRKALHLAEEDLRSLRHTSHEQHSKLSAAEREKLELLQRIEAAEEAQSDLEHQVKTREAENTATYATLEEYRTSSHKWRQRIDELTAEREEREDHLKEVKHQLKEHQQTSTKLHNDVSDARRERDDLEATVVSLERELEQSQESTSGMRRRLEKLHSDIATAASQLASEKEAWRAKEDEYRMRCESLEAQSGADVQSRSQSEEEARTVKENAQEALQETVRSLQAELAEQKLLTQRFERDHGEAKEAGRAETERVQRSLEAANQQSNVVRAELEGELSKLRLELGNVKTQAELEKDRHVRILEEEHEGRREALRKVNDAHSVALNDAQEKHETFMQRMHADHERALGHAVEDKQRAEFFLNERLALSDSKLQHYQDKVLHLEERLQIAKSAAQAAAMSAQSRGLPSTATKTSTLPDKISPQALRESILVLQEQLQDREAQIEKLRNHSETEASAKLKSRDDEIAWLRELLAVRGEELTDLVNTLAQPTFDRNAVRDTAIRIQANLQMERQERDRLSQSPQTLPEQAIASLSSFATPKAVQLSSAFNKWRSNMESAALKNAQQQQLNRARRAQAYTPSKAAHTTTAIPAGYASGLMTPPASNLRNTPSPEPGVAISAPQLDSRPGTQSKSQAPSAASKAGGRHASFTSEGPTTPLLRSQSYDLDAEEGHVHMQDLDDGLEDDDLDDMADHQPPAFRNLEAELGDAGEGST